MRRVIVGIAVVVVLALGFPGCRSSCARLCDRQIRCLGGQEATRISPEDQQELCETVCQAMEADPEREAAMERVAACGDVPCARYAACVRAATGP